jgi:hypothetical protein
VKRVILAVLLAGACTSGSPTVAVPSTTPSPTSSPTPTAKATLVLEVDGLGLSDGTGRIRHLPFASTTAAQIQAVVVDALGTTGSSNDLPECGQGQRTSYDVGGLTLLLDKTAWVGWTSKVEGLTTADGIGVGVDRATVEAAGTAVTFSQSSLGTEFTAENSGFGGLMNGSAKTDKVTTVYTGETCFFR